MRRLLSSFILKRERYTLMGLLGGYRVRGDTGSEERIASQNERGEGGEERDTRGCIYRARGSRACIVRSADRACR